VNDLKLVWLRKIENGALSVNWSGLQVLAHADEVFVDSKAFVKDSFF
jgi:hypothetical protein